MSDVFAIHCKNPWCILPCTNHGVSCRNPTTYFLCSLFNVWFWMLSLILIPYIHCCLAYHISIFLSHFHLFSFSFEDHIIFLCLPLWLVNTAQAPLWDWTRDLIPHLLFMGTEHVIGSKIDGIFCLIIINMFHADMIT